MAATNTSPHESNHAVVSVDTAGMEMVPATADHPHEADPTDPSVVSDLVSEIPANQPGASDADAGQGTDGEIDQWQARYSQRNFYGRIAFRAVLTIGAGVLAAYTWGMNHANLTYLTWTVFAVVGLLWLTLGYRMFQAHYSHFYRLSNRRLFVSTGVVNRRRDMLELLRVKDVFTRQQSLLERWLELGTVVVVPNEKELPTFYLTGVDNPKQVMDMIWHHARTERDKRSLKVENV